MLAQDKKLLELFDILGGLKEVLGFGVSPRVRHRLTSVRDKVVALFPPELQGRDLDCDCCNCKYVRQTQRNLLRTTNVASMRNCSVGDDLVNIWNEAVLTFPCQRSKNETEVRAGPHLG